MTYLEQAEHLVRNHPANKELMELGETCEVEITNTGLYRLIGKKVVVNSDFNARSLYSRIDLAELDSQVKKGNAKILGKPPHLEHWLRVLNEEDVQATVTFGVNKMLFAHADVLITFNLTTGKPATEKDAEEFINLVQ